MIGTLLIIHLGIGLIFAWVYLQDLRNLIQTEPDVMDEPDGFREAVEGFNTNPWIAFYVTGVLILFWPIIAMSIFFLILYLLFKNVQDKKR